MAALFRRLKDHDRVAREIPRLGEITGRAEQHRSMPVMAAGVHLARRPGGVSEICRLLDRQRVHIGAQRDYLDIAFGRRLAALDDADDAGAAETCRDFVAAEFPQALRHECCGAMHVVQQFGVLMDIPAPGLNIGLQIGDAVNDGHGNSRFGLSAFSLSSTQPRSAQHSSGSSRVSAMSPNGCRLCPRTGVSHVSERASAMSPNRTLVPAIRV